MRWDHFKNTITVSLGLKGYSVNRVCLTREGPNQIGLLPHVEPRSAEQTNH